MPDVRTQHMLNHRQQQRAMRRLYEQSQGSFEYVESEVVPPLPLTSSSGEIVIRGTFDNVIPDCPIELYSVDAQGNRTSRGEIAYHVYVGDHTTPLSRVKSKKSWELAFLEEEKVEEEPGPHPNVGYLPGEDEEEPDLPREEVKTLKEIAEMMPAGVLGMQSDRQDQPYNLVFRAKAEDDPRKKLVKGNGWFEVKGCTEVLWAVATLENYNKLYDTGMEYKVSKKVSHWHDYITDIFQLPGLHYFEEGCPLFDYQKEAVEFLVSRKRAMLALSPGLGKTLTAAYAAGLLEYVGTVLLVCPASLLYYWYAELNKWSEYLPLKVMPEIWHRETGTVPERGALGYKEQFWAITNPETLVRYTDEFLFDSTGSGDLWDLLIVDESIYYKHRESKRSNALNRVAKAIPDVWLLSGAPATRYLDDMWHQFHVLNNRGYGSYWRFAEDYCRVESNVWAKTVIANKRDGEEMVKTNFEDVYFARSQEQVADIPDWLMVDLDVAMKPRQEEVYAKLQKDLEVQIGGRDDDEVITIDNRLGLILRSIQVASNPVLLGAVNSSGKWSALPELMDIYPGPYLVWVNFIRTGEMLQELLWEGFGTNKVALMNGSTSMAERNDIVDRFQASYFDALVVNQEVGSKGFTLTKARTAFFVERGYSDTYFQALHRNRRIGTTISPVVINMRSVTQAGNRTIDHVVHDCLDYRTGMIKKITIGNLRGILEE